MNESPNKEENLMNEDEKENDEYKKYYTNYKSFIEELKNLQKDIEKQLKDYKEKSNTDKNTVNDENKIKESFTNFNEKLSELQTAYNDRNVPSSFPERTLDMRQKELQKFRIKLDEWKNEYSIIEDRKYSYKQKIDEEAENNLQEKYKNYGLGELMYVQQENLKNQDEQIEEISADVKKNIVLAKNVGEVIKDQNKKLVEINEDIDETDEKMKTLTGRFKNYAKRKSLCCLVFILIIEIAIAILAYFFLYD